MSGTGRAQPSTEEFPDQYSGDMLRNEAIAFIIISSAAVGFRYYARYLTLKSFGIDDYLLFAGYVAELALCVASIRIVMYGGVGWHIGKVESMNPILLVGWAKGIYAIEIIYLTAVALPKLSALAFYLRFFIIGGTATILRPLTYGVIALIIANWIAFVLAAIFQCDPLAYWWDKSIEGGTCFDVQAFYRAMCVPNLFTDVIVLLLPVGSISKLHLELSKKLSLIAIFMTACVGIVASILRFKTFYDTAAFSDPTWASVQLVGWSVIEAGCYLLAACLPHLRPVALKLFGGFINHDKHARDDSHEMQRTTNVNSGAGYAQWGFPDREVGPLDFGTLPLNFGYDRMLSPTVEQDRHISSDGGRAVDAIRLNNDDDV